jgi:DNA excision repair protein ERCC-3
LNNGPIIVQSDMEILLEVNHQDYVTARDSIAPFTELIKSPEHLHTYKISHLSLWNAAAAGLSPDEVLERLNLWTKYPVPHTVITEIREYMGRYGKTRIVRISGELFLESDSELFVEELLRNKSILQYLGARNSPTSIGVVPGTRGHLKMALTQTGFPVQDLAGYVEGAPLTFGLRDTCLDSGKPFVLRNYQQESAQVFYASGSEKGGSGVVVLPCGAGKTVVGISAMHLMQTRTLILSPNIIAARQWKKEILDKTDLQADQVCEYSGEHKEIGPVTVATYQILTQRKREDETFKHFSLFEMNKWGLIIYDEVHLLPAPIFRVSAEMQATRRLGLTATLVREDGKETEVFSLIGPKKYDVPWKILEKQGWIAKANCEEIRIPLQGDSRMEYAVTEMKDKIRMASCNPLKFDVVKILLEKHSEDRDRILIIGQYIEQLEEMARRLNLPLITGKTKNAEREVLYKKFRDGIIPVLMVSKVGNFAVDLPDANVLIQISGTFGSRQEEAQRLGRVLRPKSDQAQAYFYSIITKETREQEFAMNRQLFLAEQGYSYKISYFD